VHYRPDNVSTGKLVATLITTGTALHLAGRGINRLGRCATDGCDNVYADLSRTGQQRYCSPACANRTPCAGTAPERVPDMSVRYPAHYSACAPRTGGSGDGMWPGAA
jgi:hypothetical protein